MVGNLPSGTHVKVARPSEWCWRGVPLGHAKLVMKAMQAPATAAAPGAVAEPARPPPPPEFGGSKVAPKIVKAAKRCGTRASSKLCTWALLTIY